MYSEEMTSIECECKEGYAGDLCEECEFLYVYMCKLDVHKIRVHFLPLYLNNCCQKTIGN